MKLHLYQSIHYLVTDENPDFAIDFYSPKNTLEHLHSHICSFTGNNYSCQEAAIFGKSNPDQPLVTIEKCTAGFSLITDTRYAVPVMFSEEVFHSGNYAFTQFNDSSPEGIKEAVNVVSNYIISQHIQPVSDSIMLRMVNESGGFLTGDLQNYAFQVCIALV
ncbi:MAG: hypothetical protein HQ557_01645 [Bacteroidetes bacterium]|nr:hypothetical protein [Bacteroidota bacterium]